MTPARSPDLFLPTWTTVSENLADLQEYLHADASDAGLISYMHLSQLGFIVGQCSFRLLFILSREKDVRV